MQTIQPSKLLKIAFVADADAAACGRIADRDWRVPRVVCRVAHVPGYVPVVVEAAGVGDFIGQRGLGSDHA